jgi:hypothetical protein
MIEKIFDDAAMSYDRICPSLLARVCWMLPRVRVLYSCRQHDAWGQRDASLALIYPAPYCKRQNAQYMRMD